MNTHQSHKNCVTFMNKLYNSRVYESIKSHLLGWKMQNKDNVAAIDTFMRISKLIHENGEDDKLIDYYNRCLVKDAVVAKKYITVDHIEELAAQNPQSNQIIDSVQEMMKKQKQTKSPDNKFSPSFHPNIEQIKDHLILPRLQAHSQWKQITKILNIYLKSIITLSELKSMIAPIYSTDPSLFHCLIKLCQDVHQRRRKCTIFAPLNELVDQKYPLSQVGESYILIPDGYANYSKNWKTNHLEEIMNRKCVSVPLGSEVSFIISKKTEYQEQLFNFEDQRYEVDNALQSFKASIKLIERCCSMSDFSQVKMDSPMLQRVVNELYPNENVYNIFIRNIELAKTILLPRLIQKQSQLRSLREKFVKVCQEVASKNFYKSLDYRCFYFAKNDKKYNSTARFEKEIELRKKQILQCSTDPLEQQSEDRESLQRGRQYPINSFDNITKQNFIQNIPIPLTFDRKLSSTYPAYPDNQIHFILNFKNKEILNDVLEIIMFYCSRKNLLELLIFKIMKVDIKKKLKRSPLLLNIIENKDKIVGNGEVLEIMGNGDNFNSNKENSKRLDDGSMDETFINDQKGIGRIFKDSDDEFMQMIEEDEEPAFLQELDSPFEGPDDGHTFIGTKSIYLFMRYVTTIYQRFLKAKQYSDQLSSITIEQQQQKVDIYKFFLTIMIYKVKDKKYFEEYLRKLFCKNAFIFFTLDKLVISAVKLINNINPDSLTYQILKDQTKDYQLGIFDWEKFPFPTVTMQLTRLYKQKEMLFRFTYSMEGNFYISAWDPPFKENQGEIQEIEEMHERIQKYTSSPTPILIPKQSRKVKTKIVNRSEEFYSGIQENITMKGEVVLLNLGRKSFNYNRQLSQQDIMKEIEKLKKLSSRL